jgi:transposase
VAAGREPTPRARGIARQSVQTTEGGGPERGDDGGKRGQGRPRQRLVDTLGLLGAVLRPRAGLEDGSAAPPLRALMTGTALPRRETILGDHTDHHHALPAWMAPHRPTWRLAVKPRPAGRRGFTPWRQRWGVERPKAWNGRDRRHRKDDERKPTSSAVMMQLRPRHLLLHRLAPQADPACR